MLKIAVPNKGSLADPAAQILREAGYRQRPDAPRAGDDRPRQRRRVLLPAPARHRGVRRRGHARRRAHRPRPGARLAGAGRGAAHARLRRVDVPLRRAGRAGSRCPRTSTARRVATSYAGVLEDYFKERAVNAKVVRLDGAVESAVRLGVADAIADVVETGNTLAQAGLEVFGEPILSSEAVLVTRGAAGSTIDPDGFDVFLRRIQGVLVARSYVMMDYDIRSSRSRRRARSRPASSPRRCRRCTARAGSRSARWCRATTRNG